MDTIQQLSTDSLKDRHFRRNVCGVSLVEFFWGLGFPIVLESTFLQLFLQQLGASRLLIGIVPSLFIFGTSSFPLVASYLNRYFRLKRGLVAGLHILSGLSILLLGLVLLFLQEPRHILPVFFTAYTLFALCLGLTVPVWFNYLVGIFSETRTVPGLGLMMLSQNIAKVISSFFILHVVARYSFSPQSSAWIFIITGIVFVVGSCFFFLTKEIPDQNEKEANPDQQEQRPETLSFFRHSREIFVRILGNRPFLIYLAADLDFYVVLTILSFYATYAVSYFGVDPAVAAGTFVGCIYAGSITVNIFLGAMNLLRLKQKLILSKCVSLSLLTILIVWPCDWSFLLISYQLGFVRAIRNMVYPPSVKKFSGRSDATDYFALAPILTILVGSGFPLLFGKLLDRLQYLGADSYRLLFGVALIFVLVTLYFSVKTDYGDYGDQASEGAPN